MGCASSSQQNGGCTSNCSSYSESVTTDFDSAVLSNSNNENSCRAYIRHASTCPSSSDQESLHTVCSFFGITIDCCSHCHRQIRNRNQPKHRKTISASLTGLHSLDPESTGHGTSESGTLLNLTLTTTSAPARTGSRSSCASVCSACDRLNAQSLQSATHFASYKLRYPTANAAKTDDTNDNNNNNNSCFSKHSSLSPIACQYCAAEANKNNSLEQLDDTIKKSSQNKIKHSEAKVRKNKLTRIKDNPTIVNSNEKLNHTETVLSGVTDSVCKKSSLSLLSFHHHHPQAPNCCRKHKHRHCQKSALHQTALFGVSDCPHKFCYQMSQSSLNSNIPDSNYQPPKMSHNPVTRQTVSSLKSQNANSELYRNAKTATIQNLPANLSNFIKLGRMNIEMNKIKILLAFRTSDSYANQLRLAAEHINLDVTICDSAETALNAFAELKPEIVIIDARLAQPLALQQQQQQQPVNTPHNPSYLIESDTGPNIDDSTQDDSSSNPNQSQYFHIAPNFNANELCRSIRNIKGSEFTCVLAYVRASFLETEQTGLLSLLQAGFNRCLPEMVHFGHCVNELIQLREFELCMQQQLRAANTLLIALDACKDGVVITGPKHDIQYANNSIEKMFGFRLDDIIGKHAQDYFQVDLIKKDIGDKINNFNEGKEWEGQICHRRKSGDSVPIWNRILPINYHNGVPDYIIYVKEFPFLFIEKLMSLETESMHNYGSLKGLRKASFDIKSEIRRPSLAKFNSVSLIEAPITRVINILMAIKESGPSFLSSTLEKAIDTLKNSEVFMPQFESFKPDDQLTSELVNSLISTNKQARRMSHEAASNKSSISNVPQTPTYAQPNLTNVPANIQTLLDRDLSWNFNIFELERITCKRPLVWLALSILNRFNVCQTLQCSENTLRNWLTMVESNYHDNPYHNSTHAADVMQATAFFLMSNRLKSVFDPLDQAICLLAAIIHDIDHPGRNSAFLCNSNHELAILYNDISVLESHHAAHAFKLTTGKHSDKVNIFKNLDRETYCEVRQSVIDMVLATEMTKHFEHLTKFVHVFQTLSLSESDPMLASEDEEGNISNSLTTEQQEATAELSTPENIVLIKRMLIKCADVSNPVRPQHLCEVWAERIAVEYCDQTDEEYKRNLPLVMPTFDRLTCSIPKSQIGFIDFFCNDMFEAWHSFGYYPDIVENMNKNYIFWKEKQLLIETKQKKSSLDSDRVKEADEDNL